MVRTMTASGNVPQFGYCDEVNMSRLVELRWALKREMKERGVNFSYMPVLIKALSLALLQYPILNSSVSQDCSSITVKASHNIGVAMDTSEGLVVPNIKSVEVSLDGCTQLHVLVCVCSYCVVHCYCAYDEVYI